MKTILNVAVAILVFASSTVLAQERVNGLGQDPPKSAPAENTSDAINGFPGSPEEYKVKDDDDLELRIKKQIVNAIYMEIDSKKQRVMQGQEAIFFLLRAYRRLQQAREAVHGNNTEELIKVAKDLLNKARVVEANRVLRYRNGLGRPDDAAEATGFRLQCELRLLQLDRTEYEKYKQER